MTNIIKFPRPHIESRSTVQVRGVELSVQIAVDLMADELAAHWGDEPAMKAALAEAGFTTEQMQRLGEAAWLKARAIRRRARGAE